VGKAYQESTRPASSPTERTRTPCTEAVIPALATLHCNAVLGSETHNSQTPHIRHPARAKDEVNASICTLVAQTDIQRSPFPSDRRRTTLLGASGSCATFGDSKRQRPPRAKQCPVPSEHWIRNAAYAIFNARREPLGRHHPNLSLVSAVTEARVRFQNIRTP
jgi:hypothetical protein